MAGALCAAVALGHASAPASEERDAAARRQEIQRAAELVRTGNGREKAMGLEVLGWGLYFTDYVADARVFAPILNTMERYRTPFSAQVPDSA